PGRAAPSARSLSRPPASPDPTLVGDQGSQWRSVRPLRPRAPRRAPSRLLPAMPSSAQPGAQRARKTVDRDILRLAIPSLGALVAEPLFLLTDSAFIARVSTTSLAGLGLASTVLTTIVGLALFL